MRLRPSLISSAVVLAVVVGSALPSGATSNPFGAKTPSQILSLATSAMRNAGSVHSVAADSYGGVVQITLSTDSAQTEGLQTQKLGGGTETSRLIGTTLFIYGDKTSYAQDFGVKNSKLANEWVLVPATNKNYANIALGILLPSLLQQVEGVSALKNLGLFKINGQEAVAIRGALAPSAGGSGGSQTLYVSTTAPYRPIALTDAGVVSGQKVSSTVLFSKWGEKVAIARPSTFVTATSVTFP
jgi:hypothetical protein